MWYFALWLVRSSIMSELKPLPTAIPPNVLPRDPRTLADVEADLTLAGTELAHHRSRRGELTNKAERIAQRPALIVHELNCLIDEWAALNATSRLR